jgi:hypothetical protein
MQMKRIVFTRTASIYMPAAPVISSYPQQELWLVTMCSKGYVIGLDLVIVPRARFTTLGDAAHAACQDLKHGSQTCAKEKASGRAETVIRM